jgi:hypothetical protein
MRWGVRRYQNKDGSLTPAGEKRYAKSKAFIDSVDAANKAGAPKTTSKADTSNISDDHVKARSKPVSSMTDKELNDAMLRLQREKQYAQLYSELTAPKKSAGAKYVDKFIENLGGKTIETVASTVNDKFIKKGAGRIADKVYSSARARLRGNPKAYAFLHRIGLMS